MKGIFNITFKRHSSCRVDEPPDSFYEFGMADYAVVMKGYSRSTAEAEKGLRTAKMREQEERERAGKHPHTIIRIEFADGFLLQVIVVNSTLLLSE